MSIDLAAAREVSLDLLERAGDLAEELEAELLEAFSAGGGVAPPKGFELREEFEAWAADAGCRTRAGIRAPVVGNRPLFRVARGKWVKGALGREWQGETPSWHDGGQLTGRYGAGNSEFAESHAEWCERTSRMISTLLDARRFAAHPPTAEELLAGWRPPSWLALEQHEQQLLDGDDPATGLPLEVAAWLGKLVHAPKRAWAESYCRHRLEGAPAPADTGEGWIVKARKRADQILRAVEK